MTSNVNLLSSQAIQQPGLPHSSQQHRGPAVHSQAVSAAAAPTETVGWVLEQHYDILGKIGEGTYGVVYLATSKRDKKQLYAIKKFKTGRVSSKAVTACSRVAYRCKLLVKDTSKYCKHD